MRSGALTVALLPFALAPAAIAAPPPAPFSFAAASVAPARADPAVSAREAVVVVTVENMYSAADESKDVVSQASLGQTVELLETQDSFARVRTPDHYEGWLPRAAFAEYPDPGAPRYASAGRVAEVTSLMANVYRQADVASARPILQAPLGTRLELAEASGERWFAVRLPSGELGYVQQGDVRVGDATAPRRRGTPADLVATARRFLGVPYLWGGMTARGIDCSGLASRVYHVNGFELPRDADLQFEDANAAVVPRARLRPGDLLFFGRDRQHISHVGIYLGHGRFINATTYRTPMVREDRLADPHWAGLYQGARRPR